MKPLSDMPYLEKAWLLATLFPSNIDSFLDYLRLYAGFILSIQDENNNAFSVEKWVIETNSKVAAYQVLRTLRANRKSIRRRSRVFAALLFNTTLAIFTVHYLIEFSEEEYCPIDFSRAINLLFQTQR